MFKVLPTYIEEIEKLKTALSSIYNQNIEYIKSLQNCYQKTTEFENQNSTNQDESKHDQAERLITLLEDTKKRNELLLKNTTEFSVKLVSFQKQIYAMKNEYIQDSKLFTRKLMDVSEYCKTHTDMNRFVKFAINSSPQITQNAENAENNLNNTNNENNENNEFIENDENNQNEQNQSQITQNAENAEKMKQQQRTQNYQFLTNYLINVEYKIPIINQMNSFYDSTPLTFDDKVKNLLNEEQINQLEQWTNLRCRDVLFDSNGSNWFERNSELFDDVIKGGKELLFLVQDIVGEKFGFFCHVTIPSEEGILMKNDPKAFHFNIESKRFEKPMKFEILPQKGGYQKLVELDNWQITLGQIRIGKKNGTNSYCCQNNSVFDYKGIENALCGKTNTWQNKGKNFALKRIVVIQMSK